MPVPKNVINETVYKVETVPQEGDHPPQVIKTVVAEKNTNERAIVKIRVPKKRVEEEIVEVNEATGEHHTKKVEKFVEID